MVYAGFRDARRDIQDPPLAQSDPGAAPDPLLEKQEKKSFKDLATILSQLPKPEQGSVRFMPVANAIKAGFLSALDKDHADMFTPSELRLYRHAQDHRLNWDIPG